MRLRFWLLMMDLALGRSHRLWLWCLRHASDATDWGEGADCGDGVPF